MSESLSRKKCSRSSLNSSDSTSLEERNNFSRAPNTEKHTVHWFRKGLRLHDNPSLREGIQNSTTYRCVFIIDPWFAGSSNVGINKWRFEI